MAGVVCPSFLPDVRKTETSLTLFPIIRVRVIKPLCATLLAACIATLSPGALAQNDLAISNAPSVSLRSASMPIPAAPGLAAESYMVIDYHTGKVIAERDSGKRLDPASLTKMMTAYLVSSEIKFRGLSPEDTVPVSSNAHSAIGSRSFLEPGSLVSVRDLMYGLVVQSGNDAGIALAEHIGGTEEGFVSMMNQMAQRMGMNDTQFANSTGLPSKDHYTTARDMAVLARAVIRDHPDHYKLYSVEEFTYNGITQKNRNTLLLRDPTVDGIKTGHTKAAGYCLVASAKRGDMRLISVLMGARNEQLRSTESLRALNYGFRFFETVKLASAQKKLGDARVWGGTVENVAMAVADDKFVTLQTGQSAAISREMHLSRDLIAPIEAGQELGLLKVKVEDELIAELPIVAMQPVEQGGFFTRTADRVKRLLD